MTRTAIPTFDNVLDLNVNTARGQYEHDRYSMEHENNDET